MERLGEFVAHLYNGLRTALRLSIDLRAGRRARCSRSLSKI
jgi:hypothetical protein